MEQHQQDHVCKVCNASFLSGRILGGHMRNHIAKRKVKIETFDMGIDQGYGLRENPKKSWKKSSSSGFNFNHTDNNDSDDTVTLQDNDVKCSVCGKQFGSPKSLHGHMRHHSAEERHGVRCKDCGKGFRSLRSLTGHMRLHSGKQRKMMMMMIDGGGGESSSRPPDLVVSITDSDTTVSLVRKKKRSNRMRYKANNSSSFSSLNDQSVSVSVSDIEIEQEVEEVAMSLMLLSKGLYDLGVSKNKIIECSSDCNDEIGVEFEAPIESGLVSLSYDPPETQKETDESEESEDFIEFDVDEIKESNGFQCRICNKNFATYQALGGHQTVHRTTKSFMINHPIPNPPEEETDETIEHKRDAIMEVEDEVSSVKEHKCHICCKKFVSGQALGGHKRAHIAAAKTKEEQQSLIAVKQEIYECYKHESLLVDVMAKAKNAAVISF